MSHAKKLDPLNSNLTCWIRLTAVNAWISKAQGLFIMENVRTLLLTIIFHLQDIQNRWVDLSY